MIERSPLIDGKFVLLLVTVTEQKSLVLMEKVSLKIKEETSNFRGAIPLFPSRNRGEMLFRV